MGWRIYAAIMSVYLAWAYAVLVFLGPSIYDLVDIPISLIALLGVFGFAFKRAWIGRRFWKSWLVVMLAWDFFYNVAVARMLGVVDYRTVSPVEAAITLALLVPFYSALFLYGYRSEKLWNPRGD